MVRNNAKAAKASSELRVITKTRDLSKALFLTTATTPKRFRFSLCDRIESNAIEALTHMIWANDTRLDIKDPKSPRIRRTITNAIAFAALAAAHFAYAKRTALHIYRLSNTKPKGTYATSTVSSALASASKHSAIRNYATSVISCATSATSCAHGKNQTHNA
ncbi:hypothetical protein [Bifidobacterium sp.]|jgi:hypothetical protein|uniref:hypothetical protein n=1 Tax=Bifidobacterium sp. TaxID=41200 RepID=UPI0025BEAD4E|nr:hypothetical protein [Bifidobacterium sp.]MCI1636182.1 hypothetical protein [Bifidobacterium sp.]